MASRGRGGVVYVARCWMWGGRRQGREGHETHRGIAGDVTSSDPRGSGVASEGSQRRGRGGIVAMGLWVHGRRADGLAWRRRRSMLGDRVGHDHDWPVWGGLGVDAGQSESVDPLLESLGVVLRGGRIELWDSCVLLMEV